MTAFGQQDGIRFAHPAENPTHIAMCSPVQSDRCNVIDGDDPSELAGSDQFPDFGKIRMIAQHMAHSDPDSAFPGAPRNLTAFVQALRNRLFEQKVVSGVDRLDGRVEMGILRRRNQHHIGLDTIGKEIVVIHIAAILRQSEPVGHRTTAQLVQFDDGHDLQPAGITTGIFEVFVGPVPGSDHGDLHRTGHDRFNFHQVFTDVRTVIHIPDTAATYGTGLDKCPVLKKVYSD